MENTPTLWENNLKVEMTHKDIKPMIFANLEDIFNDSGINSKKKNWILNQVESNDLKVKSNLGFQVSKYSSHWPKPSEHMLPKRSWERHVTLGIKQGVSQYLFEWDACGKEGRGATK